jgi:hypothetical protein
MSDQWETFCDVGYYHMWRLRRKTERGWNDGFHINTKAEAEGLCELLNKLERDRDEARAVLVYEQGGIHATAGGWAAKYAEAIEQRDRLAEVAQAVWDRWETPLWKDHPPTALVMNKLRDALEAVKGGSHE